MTREQYIQLRKTNNFTLLAYNHYYEKMVEKSATPMDFVKVLCAVGYF